MKMLKKSLILLLLVILMAGSEATFAQVNNKHLSVDLYGGPTLIHGDMRYKLDGFAGTFAIQYAINEVFSIQSAFTYGDVEGADLDRRGRSFSNRFNQITLRLNANFLNIYDFTDIDEFMMPYGHIGIGIVNSEIMELEQPENMKYPGQRYKGMDLAFQSGLGTRVYLSKSFDLNFRWDINFVASDWLDGFNPDVIANKHDDSYSSINVGVTYKFGGGSGQHIDWNERWLEQ